MLHHVAQGFVAKLRWSGCVRTTLAFVFVARRISEQVGLKMEPRNVYSRAYHGTLAKELACGTAEDIAKATFYTMP